MSTNTITLSTSGSWFMVGDYTIGVGWDNGPVPNTTFSQTITGNTGSLQSDVVMSWNWPDTASPTGAYGWSSVQYFNLPPVQIQNLQSLNVDFSTAISGAPNNFDLSWDMEVTAQPGASSTSVCEIMYNLHRPATWGQPGITYSVGTVAGMEDIFVENVPADNLNNIPDVIVYPTGDMLTGAINLADIIDPLVAIGLISPKDYFNGVQLGAETFQGSGSATINNVSVAEVVGLASFTLPAEQAIVYFQAGDITIPVAISDSAASIVANLSGLESLAADNLLSSITLTDASTPTITVSATEWAQDGAVLKAISSPFILSIPPSPNPLHWLIGSSGDFAIAANWNAGSVPNASDVVQINASGTYTVTSSANEGVNSLTTASGATLDVTGGTFTIVNGTGSGANAGTIEVGPAGTLLLYGGFANAGTLAALGSTIDVTGAIFGSGALQIGSNGALDLLSGGSVAGGVQFSGVAGDLVLTTGTGQLSGAITGAIANTVDLTFQPLASGDNAVWQQSGSGGNLSIETSTGSVLQTLSFNGQYTSSNFSLSSDNQGGMLITILTPTGQIEEQINEVYQSVLQRPAASTELTSQFAIESSSGIAAVVSAVVDSPEAQFNAYPIIQIIQLATGNLPTAAQLAGWVPFIEQNGLLTGQAQTNSLLDQMAEAFVASDNFAKIYSPPFTGTDVNPNSPVTAQEMQVIIKAATGIAATQTQINTWVSTGLTIDQVFVDFALGDQYTAFSQAGNQQYLTTVADAAAGIQASASVIGSANASLVAHA